jgi:ribosomal protein S18 acetylase RimI-like enzyme
MTRIITSLERKHDRADFDCGETALNTFLQRFARQQSDKDFSRTYVATTAGSNKIKGYYAISSASVDFKNWPVGLRLPRYPVPVVLLARLAVDIRAQGQGVGQALLQHAMQLALATAGQIGVYSMAVDAKNEAAAGFYASYGFQRFETQASRLFLTTEIIRRAALAAQIPVIK